MKAARFYGKGDIRVEDVVEPTIEMPDDVLVEVRLCGICGTDLHEYLAGPIVTPVEPHALTGATLPQTLGHEFSAVVTDVGAAVTTVRAGDRVAVMPSIVCGTCYYCMRGLQNLCERFATTGLSSATGGLARYALVKDYQVAVLPDELSDTEGAVVEPAAVAAYGVDTGRLDGGDVVLVTGAGPIGALTGLYASALGAGHVVVVEPNPNRAALARSLDVGPVYSPDDAELPAALAEVTGGVGADLVVECSGTSAGLNLGIAQARKAGRIVQAGLHTEPATFDAMALAEKNLTLFGTWCFQITDWPRIIRLVATGRYPIDKVVTSTVGLTDIVAAFDTLTDPASDDLKMLVAPAG